MKYCTASVCFPTGSLTSQTSLILLDELKHTHTQTHRAQISFPTQAEELQRGSTNKKTLSGALTGLLLVRLLAEGELFITMFETVFSNTGDKSYIVI